MASLWEYAGAGLMAGVGKSMAEQGMEEIREDGRMKREIMLEELRQRGRSSENALNRDTQIMLKNKEIAAGADERRARVGLLNAQAEYYGRRPTGADEHGLTPGDRRLWEAAKNRHTTKSLTGEITTNWELVEADLRARGRDDLADMAMSPTMKKMAEDKAIDERVSKEAEGRTSFFKPRSSEFPETGGDMEAWKEQRRKELKGGEKPKPPAVTAAQPPKMTEESETDRQALEEARDAIRRGAPRDKVIERLKKAGIDPTGL